MVYMALWEGASLVYEMKTFVVGRKQLRDEAESADFNHFLPRTICWQS